MAAASAAHCAGELLTGVAGLALALLAAARDDSAALLLGALPPPPALGPELQLPPGVLGAAIEGQVHVGPGGVALPPGAGMINVPVMMGDAAAPFLQVCMTCRLACHIPRDNRP